MGHWGYLTRNTEEDGNGVWRQTVRGFTIDRVMEAFGLDRVDVLKLDIEGAEREVLRDPSALIARVDAVVVELHERIAFGCRDAFQSATETFQEHWHQGENRMRGSRGRCRAPVRAQASPTGQRR